jgi:hypothetical protein
MNFRETLGRHLLAIETRDLELKRTKGDFMEAHRAWFAMQGWTLAAKPVEIYEGGSLGVAVLHLDYREGGKSRASYLTLVFERQGDAWLMVQDQNTPIK